MGGCLGCCITPKPILFVDEPSKGLRVRGHRVKKTNITEDFWSTGTRDMDNSAVPSQRSISSVSASNRTDTHSGSSSASNPPEFVNHGRLLWNQTRQQWNGSKKIGNKAHQIQEPKLSWNATYDSLLGTNKSFPQSIPLSKSNGLTFQGCRLLKLYDPKNIYHQKRFRCLRSSGKTAQLVVWT